MGKCVFVILFLSCFIQPLFAKKPTSADLSSIAKKEISVENKDISQQTRPSIGTIVVKDIVAPPSVTPTAFLQLSMGVTKLKGQSQYANQALDLGSLQKFTRFQLEASHNIQFAWSNRVWLDLSYGSFQTQLLNPIGGEEKANFHSMLLGAGLEWPIYSYKDWGIHTQIGLGQLFLTQSSEAALADENLSETLSIVKLKLKSQAFWGHRIRLAMAYSLLNDLGNSPLDSTNDELQLGFEIGWQ